LVMGPWFIRNYLVFGSLIGPQAANMIWLTNYDQIFSFPPNINYFLWINQGFVNIINPRISALLTNLTSTLAVQGSIILLPLIIFAGWRLRKDQRIGVLLISWIGIILLMSFVFPFAGRRGGFFHAGAALQPVLWSLAPVGMEALIEKVGLKRSWNIKTAARVFSMSLIIFSVLFTGYITLNKIYQKDNHRFIWGLQEKRYESMGGLIESNNLEKSTVIVGNPPGFFLATGNQAIAIPDGDEQNILLVADEFNADYLILEPGGFPDLLSGLYDGSSLNKSFDLLNDLDGVKIYEINHDQ